MEEGYEVAVLYEVGIRRRSFAVLHLRGLIAFMQGSC